MGEQNVFRNGFGQGRHRFVVFWNHFFNVRGGVFFRDGLGRDGAPAANGLQKRDHFKQCDDVRVEDGQNRNPNSGVPVGAERAGWATPRRRIRRETAEAAGTLCGSRAPALQNSREGISLDDRV